MPDDHLIYAGDRFRVVRKSRTLPNGEVDSRELILHPGAVAILPVLDDPWRRDARIVLIRNYRLSVDERLIEIPAGTLEPGEDPLAAAHRELAEETGYRADSMERITWFHPSPGILDERMWLFLASRLRPGPTATEPGEDIRPLVLTRDEALAAVRGSEIHDAKTLIGLLWLESFQGNTRDGPALSAQ